LSFREVLILKLRAFSLKVKLKLVFKVLLRAYIGRTVPEGVPVDWDNI
jgi:hypothetical protein